RGSPALSLNPPMPPSKLLACPGRKATSAAEAAHLLDAAPCGRQRLPICEAAQSAKTFRWIQAGRRRRSGTPGAPTINRSERERPGAAIDLAVGGPPGDQPPVVTSLELMENDDDDDDDGVPAA